MTVSHARVVSFAWLLVNSALCGAPVPSPSRIPQSIDPTQVIQLAGSVHPLAKPELAQGRLNGSTMIHGMSLVFERSPEPSRFSKAAHGTVRPGSCWSSFFPS
jgi:hypothetical protein